MTRGYQSPDKNNGDKSSHDMRPPLREHSAEEVQQTAATSPSIANADEFIGLLSSVKIRSRRICNNTLTRLFLLVLLRKPCVEGRLDRADRRMERVYANSDTVSPAIRGLTDCWTELKLLPEGERPRARTATRLCQLHSQILVEPYPALRSLVPRSSCRAA